MSACLPLVCVALQAALATPGDGRSVIAVVGPEACQQLLGECLGPVEAPADPQQAQQQQPMDAASVGALFTMSEGGVTIVNWPQGQRQMARGTILCTNYQRPQLQTQQRTDE